MPRQILNDETFPLQIAAPGADRRWFVTGFLIQGTDDGIVTVGGDDGSGSLDGRMLTVTVSAPSGGVTWPEGSVDEGTPNQNQGLVVTVTGGGDISGFIDYSWR